MVAVADAVGVMVAAAAAAGVTVTAAAAAEVIVAAMVNDQPPRFSAPAFVARSGLVFVSPRVDVV